MASQADVIKNYLIGLGFSIDSQSYAKFQGAIKTLSNTVQQVTTGMARQYSLMAVEVVGAIGSISLATVGLMDKVAKADMGYQKLALSMYMPVEATKHFKIVTDAMGESVENIRHHQEIGEKFKEKMQLSQSMAPREGSEFAAINKDVRDFMSSFSDLKIVAVWAMEYISTYAYKYLVVPFGKAKMTMKETVKWLADNIKEWTKPIGEFLGRVTEMGIKLMGIFEAIWKQLETIDFSGIWEDMKKTGNELNQTLDDMRASFRKLFEEEKVESKFVSLGTVVKTLVSSLLAGVHAIAALVIGTISLTVAAKLMTEGKPAEADAEISRGWQSMKRNFDAIQDLDVTGGWKHIAIGDKVGGGPGGKASQHDVLIQALASKYGMDPNLIKAVMMQESGGQQLGKDGKTKASSKGALGLMQLMPGTAGDLEVDPHNASQNLEGGVRYLKQLLDSSGGNVALALAKYNAGPNRKSYPLPGENEDFVKSVLAGYAYNQGNPSQISTAGVPSSPSKSLAGSRPGALKAVAGLPWKIWSGFTNAIQNTGNPLMDNSFNVDREWVERMKGAFLTPAETMGGNVKPWETGGKDGPRIGSVSIQIDVKSTDPVLAGRESAQSINSLLWQLGASPQTSGPGGTY